MITLLNTSDVLKLTIGTAISVSNVSAYVSYKDVTSSSITPAYVGYDLTATDAVLLSAAASGTTRVVDFLSITNNDSIAHLLTLYMYISSTTAYNLCKITLQAYSTLIYQEGKGFYVIDMGGNEMLVSEAYIDSIVPDDGFTTVVYSADKANSNAVANTLENTTLAPLFSCVANKLYFVYAVIFFTSAATTIYHYQKCTSIRYSRSGS